uniref:[heparan sulfate]-glucosamine N-sulfotransferase n=1 Tax=Wuchereria bancrofti TaxID=6293 RepID=A0A1I8EIL5_WUCBA
MLTLPTRRIIFWLKLAIIITCISFIFLFTHLANITEKRHYRYPAQHIPSYHCPLSNKTGTTHMHHEFVRNKTNFVTDGKVLVFVETLYSKLGKQIINILDALKIPRKVETLTKNLPLLTTAKRGRFAIIIVENYYKYLNLLSWNRQLLDKYCREYGVGIISFIGNRPNSYINAKVKGSQLTIHTQQRAVNLRFNERSRVNFIGKPGAVLQAPEPDKNDWILFDITNGYEGIVLADDIFGEERASVILDDGSEDGIERILFGHNFTHWINKLAFLDSLRYMRESLIYDDLERYVQIDIDDIFVGTSGTRMTKVDADALLQSQFRLRRDITNFTYSLGFSGYYFRNGDSLEDEGDERLIEIGKHFFWFPHMWKHNHAHEHNQTYLEAIMTQNKLFAQGMGLHVSSGYAVSPQHAGVYPVHEALYNSWQLIWNITVTSTEEYPHFRPASARRGFVHRNISVLPRQTCGLYTHTQFFHSYPDGFTKLLSNIEGGDLFFTIVINPVGIIFSIFMTHQQNYANDRLGIFSFERVVNFIKCWTNLRLRWVEPVRMASAYFARYAAEKVPVWSNPCDDPRHAKILPQAFNCSEMPLPNMLVVGPQKTGSTALATFLNLHPNFSSNDPVPSSFEEVELCSWIALWHKRYCYRYMDQFRSKIDHLIVFEKSATYFDNPDAPRTSFALLPKAKIVIILLDPAVRAYSWYHHMRAHNDTTAMTHELDQILDANVSSVLLRRLRNRCISPGRYTHHLEHWLDYYPSTQIHLVDGEQLRTDPVAAITNLVDTLHAPKFAFSDLIKFDDKKGFFCSYINGTKRCLGTGKGRKYEPLDEKLREKLDLIFRDDNIALHKLLLRNDLPIPKWLQNQLSKTNFT